MARMNDLSRPASSVAPTTRPLAGSPPLRTVAGTVRAAGLFVAALLVTSLALAQDAPEEAAEADEFVQPDAAVQVDTVPSDVAIQRRLLRIYEATRWFERLSVEVDEGVVFLEAASASQEHKEWATNLARRTEGVVGVANRMTVDERFTWSIEPAWKTLRSMARDAVERLPLIVFGLFVLAAAAGFAWLARRIALAVLGARLSNRILLQVASTLAVVPVALIGIYVFLQVAGLTRLAATVLGGTGLFGLIIGIAFRDIAENFLASVLISIKRPFRLGHLIEVQGKKGFVQSVTTRGTLLMTIEGNHIHVPNSEIYKSTVYNFSANPRSRFDFSLGIDYGDSATKAQQVCLQVLREHPAVLTDPEPLVLVEELGASSVVLRVYFWVNVHEHSGLKVRSAVIRQVKRAVEDAGLTMPDDSREVIFPRGVPVHMVRDEPAAPPAAASPRPAPGDEESSNAAEGDLSSDSDDLREQTEGSAALDLGPDLIADEKAPESTPEGAPGP